MTDFVPKQFDQFLLVIGYNSRVFYPIMHESFQFVLGREFCHKQSTRKELRIECTCNKTSTDDKGVIVVQQIYKEKSPTFHVVPIQPPEISCKKENGLQVFQKKRLHFFPSTMKKNNKAFDGICKIMFRITKLLDQKRTVSNVPTHGIVSPEVFRVAPQQLLSSRSLPGFLKDVSKSRSGLLRGGFPSGWREFLFLEDIRF